jgi:hypothetical protein
MLGGAVAVGDAATAEVGAEAAVLEPFLLAAVTAKRRVDPPSADTGTYVVAVAPPMALQLAPPESQRNHW